MPLEHAILAFIEFEPMSGYDLKKFFDQSVAHFWSATQSHIYKSLEGLEKKGWAEAHVIQGEGKPNRKQYQITDEGRSELRRWLVTPLPLEQVREASLIQIFFSHFSTNEDLREHNIVAIDGVDTRKITKMLRTEGSQKCVISTTDSDHDSLIQKAIDSPDMAGSDYVKEVSVKEPYEWNPDSNGKYRVVAFDYGIKYNILRLLADAGCRVVVMPATASAEEALAQNPDGVFLSNGPGDPAALPYIYPTVEGLLGKTPIFGICLGHQILGHALGGNTYKLKFGHRGGNQPVMNHKTGKVEISAQNHGFAVDPDSLNKDDVEVTHTNLNDGSVEGLAHKTLPVFSVQYHPEASPGPHDSRYLFQQFLELMDQHKG